MVALPEVGTHRAKLVLSQRTAEQSNPPDSFPGQWILNVVDYLSQDGEPQGNLSNWDDIPAFQVELPKIDFDTLTKAEAEIWMVKLNHIRQVIEQWFTFYRETADLIEINSMGTQRQNIEKLQQQVRAVIFDRKTRATT